MRALVYLILAFVGVYFVYTGLQTPVKVVVTPPAHVHTPTSSAANQTATATRTTTRTASVVFDREHPGYKVYRQRGCNVCHGADLLGSNMGPSLENARKYWDRESLTAYLANPDSFIQTDERLQRLDTQFARFVMPAFDDMTPEEFEALAGLVLEPADAEH